MVTKENNPPISLPNYFVLEGRDLYLDRLEGINMGMIKEILLEKGFRLFKVNKNEELIIKDKNGYLYKISLKMLMKQNKKSMGLKIARNSNVFSLRNIERYLTVNNLSFNLCEGNVFVDENNNDLQFYCNKCNKFFYSSWGKIERNYYGDSCADHNLSDARYSLRSMYHWLLKYEDNEIYENEIDWNDYLKSWEKHTFESNTAIKLKDYCIKNYNAIEEFEECINPKTKFPLPYDIYIPCYKIYIEVQGQQHKEFSNFFHDSEKSFEYQKYKDKIKKEHALKNGYFLEISSNTGIYPAIEKVNDFINGILNND